MRFTNLRSLCPSRSVLGGLLSSAAFAVAALASASGHANTVVVTYTGQVGFGFDTTGMFGVAGANYNNQAYTLTYTIDDLAVGAASIATPTMTQITGLGAHSPVHAALTVNGVTRTIDGFTEGTAQQYDLIHASGQPYQGVGDKIRQVSKSYSYEPGVRYHDYSAETYVFSYDQDFVLSPDYHWPLTYPGNRSTDSIYNLVQFNDYDYVAGKQVNYAYFNLNVGRAVVTSAVPEPENVGLLLAGLITVGCWARVLRASSGRAD